MMKATFLTIISLLITASASAGRYYYRSYHYYGTPDDGGKYLFLIIVGILLLLGLIATIISAIQEPLDKNLAYEREMKKNSNGSYSLSNKAIFIILSCAIAIASILVKIHQEKAPEQNPTHKTNDIREEDSSASRVV